MNSELEGTPPIPLLSGGYKDLLGSVADNGVHSFLASPFVDVKIKHEVFESEDADPEPPPCDIEDDYTISRDKFDMECKDDDSYAVMGVCQEAFSSNASKENNSEEKPFSCNYCGKTFARKTNHKRHLMTHTKEKPYSCSDCGKTFGEKSNLKLHMMTHTGERPFTCSYCGKTFAHKMSHKIHLMTHTGERPFSCKFCGKTFIDKSNHKKHLLTHTGDKPYSCIHCKKTFADKSNQKQHLLTHTEEKSFQCKHCGKSFHHSSRLEKHLETHKKDRGKSFTCNPCGKTFTEKSTFREHMMTHAKEKSLSCSYCGKDFTQKSLLLDHMQGHTDEPKLYYCNYCENIYTTEIALTYHMRSHTGPSSDQQSVNAGFQRLHHYETKWSEEKRKILFCFAYSRYEKWGNERTAIFEERLKAELPSEKIETNSVAKFESIVSHIAQYLPIEEIRKAEEEGQREAIIDFFPDCGDNQESLLHNWSREEEWALLWTYEYSKIKYSNWRERCKEWKVIYDKHYPNKNIVSIAKLLIKKHRIYIQKSFTDSEIKYLRENVNAMVKSNKCPQTNPLEVPRNDNLPEHVQNRESASLLEVPNPSFSNLLTNSTSSTNLKHPEELKRPLKREEPFTCSTCGKKFSNKDFFINHMSEHISTGTWI